MTKISNETDKDQSVTEVSSLAQYIEWVNNIGKKAVEEKNADEKITDKKIANEKTESDQTILFRGMANTEWKVASSLYRRLETNLEKNIDIESDNILFLEMTKKLLNDARQEGHGIKNGQKLTDLELLADFQHYSAATCMIDFTKHSLIALCFACETAKKEDSKEADSKEADSKEADGKEADSKEADSKEADSKEADGKIVAFNSRDDSYNEISIEEAEQPIEHFLQNEKLWILLPKKLNSRIASQQSVFVLGSPILSEKFDICKIKAEYKKSILEELKRNGISAGMLFDDFVGFSSLNSPDKKYESWETDSGFVSGIIKLFKKKHDNKNLESAIESFNDAINSNSKYSSQAYFYCGYAKDELGKFEDAILDYNEAIKLNPKYWAAYNNRGIAKYENFKKLQSNKTKNAINDYSDVKEAINDYSESIKLNSKNSSGYYNRGLAKHDLGMITYKTCGITSDNLCLFQEAISDYNKAIELNPKFSAAYKHRGFAKNKLGDKKGAMADFAKAKELNPEIDIPDLSDNSDK